MVYIYDDNQKIRILDKSFKDGLIDGDYSVTFQDVLSFDVDKGVFLKEPYIEINLGTESFRFNNPRLRRCDCHGYGYGDEKDKIKEVFLEFFLVYYYQSDNIIISSKKGFGLPQARSDDINAVSAPLTPGLWIDCSRKINLDLFKIKNIKTTIATWGVESGIFSTDDYVQCASIYRILDEPSDPI